MGGILSISLLCALMATGLTIRGDFAALLPEHYPSVRGFNTITKKMGGLGFMMIVVEGSSAKEVGQLSHDLAARLRRQKKSIKEAMLYEVPSFIKKRALYLLSMKDLDEVKKRTKQLRAYVKQESRKRNPLVVDLDDDDDTKPKVVAPSFEDLLKKYGFAQPSVTGYPGVFAIPSKDSKGKPKGYRSVVLLRPDGLESDIPFIAKMMKELKAIVKQVRTAKAYGKDIKIGYTGRYQVRLEDDTTMRRELSFVTILSFSIILLLLLLATRRKRALLLIGLPLVVGVLWTAGIARLVAPNGEINIITAFIVAILFGLGIDFGIHLFSRYLREREHGIALQEALVETLTSTGSAGLIAVFTSASAFLVIQLTDLKALSQFGQLAGIGLLLCLLAMFTVFPALAALMERSTPVPAGKASSASKDTFWLKIKPRKVYWLFGLVLGGGCLLGGGLVLGTGAVKIEYNMWRLITQGPAVKLYDKLKKEVFLGELEPGIILLQDQSKLRHFQQELEKEIEAGKWPTIKSVFSINTLVRPKQEQLAKYQKIKEIKKILDDKVFRSVSDDEEGKAQLDLLKELAQAKPFEKKDVPSSLRTFLSASQPVLFVIPNINPTQLDKGILYAKALHRINKKLADGKAVIGDSNIVLSDLISLLGRDGPRSVFFVIAIVLLVLLFTLRQQKYAIWLVLSPLAVGFASLFLVMWIFGIKVNPFNVVMLPVTLGIGIDHGVYMYYHWHEADRGSVGETMNNVYFAILLASLTSFIGFGSLALATHQGVRSVGILAALGILCTTLSAFIVLPSLFTWIRRSRSTPSQ